ncbi:MAG TPA: D-hexose-6-phosphate mutarotase [Burkholderiaceae bacterium]|nr:D-hexose-6-phosphate mutarotase [Burkholderiaceae bacterium]
MATSRPTEYMGHPAVALASDDGARATVLLHGGHLVSWIPAGGQEQLYVSPTSRCGEGEAVRGGVPVIFPQFAARGPLPRHGLVRTRGWQLVEMPSHGRHAQAVLRFVADEATRRLWPHAFEAEITFSLVGQQLDIEFAVTNAGDAPFEFTAALHTYLRTNDVLKAQLEGLQGVRYEDNATGQWQQQWGDITQVVGEIDRLYHDAPAELVLREMGRKLAIAHADFTDVVVWNPGPQKAAQLSDMPDDDWLKMLCVEAARVVDPVTLPPGEEWAGMQTLIAG